MDSRIASIVAEIKAGVTAIYGPRLRGVYLFGSYARGDADGESDVDVLIVLDRVEHYVGEIERTSMLVGAISLDHGITVSRVFLPEAAWTRSDTSFVLNVREEAVPA